MRSTLKIKRVSLLIAIVIASIANEGQCKECPNICNKIYLPVCGSDGKTYDNRCMLDVTKCETDSNLNLVHVGECTNADGKHGTCPKFCSGIYMPVCGSDGKTYPNICQFEYAKCQKNDPTLTVMHHGECRKCSGVCPAIYMPVCGSDGITYNNSCLFQNKQCSTNEHLTIAHEGSCTKCPQICTAIYEPVCGTDNNTYSNLCSLHARGCLLNNENITAAYQGQCLQNGTMKGEDLPRERTVLSNTECNIICSRIYEPVCASDGLTYANDCWVKLEACEKSVDLQISHIGDCDKQDGILEAKVNKPEVFIKGRASNGRQNCLKSILLQRDNDTYGCVASDVNKTCRPEVHRLILEFQKILTEAVKDGDITITTGPQDSVSDESNEHVNSQALPPGFLSVEGHEQCLNSQMMAGTKFFVRCLPITKPDDCAHNAWKGLNLLVEKQEVTNCEA